MEALVQRLVQNPHDEDAIGRAYESGQRDPRGYAMLLEKVGTATGDPVFASHWLTEAANVWLTTLNDAHRAARALMIAIDRAPTQPAPAEKLAELYREKGDIKALVALLERRAKALTSLSANDASLLPQLSSLHEELGRLWSEPPLSQPRKASENYRRAVEFDPSNQYAIYAVRELHKASGEWAEAVPYFAQELALVQDPERRLALLQDEAEVRRNAGDLSGATQALRGARELSFEDPVLKQLLASIVLERLQAGEDVAHERAEGAQLFVELAEEFPGEHGYSYSVCALELEAGHDRAAQLAMYYAEQLGRGHEAAPRLAAYVKANPNGAVAADARQLISQVVQQGVFDDSLLEALTPSDDAPAPERVRALLEVASTLANKGKRHEAAANFEKVIAIEAANEEALGFLESFYRQGRKYDKLRDLLLAAAHSPDADVDRRVSCLRELGGLFESQLRDPESAIGTWKELVALDPDDEPARAQLRRLLERHGRWDELTALMEQEAEQLGDLEARLAAEKSIAKLHEQKRRDPVAAGHAWARIARLTPDDDMAIATAVRHFERAERADLAAQVIADTVRSVSDERARAQLYKKLAEYREASGDAFGAGEAYADSARAATDPELWQAAERCFVQAEVWDQAATAAEEQADLAKRPHDQAALFAKVADHLLRLGDEANAVLRLERAAELDPSNPDYAAALESRYVSAERFADLAQFLLGRAEKLTEKADRLELRRRAARLQRNELADPHAARESLLQILSEGDDPEALSMLADDAEERREFGEAAEYLRRLLRVVPEEQRVEVALREGKLLSEGLGDTSAAIDCYEDVLKELDPKNLTALRGIAALHEQQGDLKATAGALERLLDALEDREEKLETARRLAELYETSLDDPRAALKHLEIVRELDPEDFDALERSCEMAEQLEDWMRVTEYTRLLLEIEGDPAEISRMTRRLAELYHTELERDDEALAALLAVADQGDEDCRQEYVKLGDELGWKGIVATKLVEWNLETPVGEERNAALRGAFERFLEVDREADAANVAKELIRTRAGDAELASRLETIAIQLQDLEALGVAHDVLIDGLSGALRAEEMVRQAEIMVAAGVDALTAIGHGEQGLTSVAPDEVEALLARLAKLAPAPEQVVDLYERQVMRCKAPADRVQALARAAEVAAESDALDRARGFFDLALGGAANDDVLTKLTDIARSADERVGGDTLRRTLASALAAGGQGARDGGRTRSALLRRAALLAHRELGDTDQAFRWTGDALVAHVDDGGLDALVDLADEVGEPKRAESVLGRVLEEVFDGPLVRKVLARRASVRRDKLADPRGAADDLKRLHDLSPGDTDVMDQLSALYGELEDYRGMVHLFEDQILRGKNTEARLQIARKVARLWEERLQDPREAADAWRRVLRMKSGDPEATEGLERAKANMLGRPAPPPSPSPEADGADDGAEPQDAPPEDAAEATEDSPPSERSAPESPLGEGLSALDGPEPEEAEEAAEDADLAVSATADPSGDEARPGADAPLDDPTEPSIDREAAEAEAEAAEAEAEADAARAERARAEIEPLGADERAAADQGRSADQQEEAAISAPSDEAAPEGGSGGYPDESLTDPELRAPGALERANDAGGREPLPTEADASDPIDGEINGAVHAGALEDSGAGATASAASELDDDEMDIPVSLDDDDGASEPAANGAGRPVPPPPGRPPPPPRRSSAAPGASTRPPPPPRSASGTRPPPPPRSGSGTRPPPPPRSGGASLPPPPPRRTSTPPPLPVAAAAPVSVDEGELIVGDGELIEDDPS